MRSAVRKLLLNARSPASSNPSKLPDHNPVPCFYFTACHLQADLEKIGKSVCRSCADRVSGREYPLRIPRRAPLYWDDREVAAALGLAEPRRTSRLTITPRPRPMDSAPSNP